MKQPTHKEQMEYLKENDPITYCELHSNPTGVDSDGDGCGVIILGVIAVICLLFYFFAR